MHEMEMGPYSTTPRPFRPSWYPPLFKGIQLITIMKNTKNYENRY